MKKYKFFVTLSCVFATSILFSSCEKYDEVPPIKETTSNRSYYINPPTAMTPSETAEYNAIVAEYDSATKKSN